MRRCSGGRLCAAGRARVVPDGQGHQRRARELVRTVLGVGRPNVRHSDPAIKEVLLQLDSSMHFIIEVLDSSHLFIEESQFATVQDMLDTKLSENVFKAPQ